MCIRDSIYGYGGAGSAVFVTAHADITVLALESGSVGNGIDGPFEGVLGYFLQVKVYGQVHILTCHRFCFTYGVNIIACAVDADLGNACILYTSRCV